MARGRRSGWTRTAFGAGVCAVAAALVAAYPGLSSAPDPGPDGARRYEAVAAATASDPSTALGASAPHPTAIAAGLQAAAQARPEAWGRDFYFTRAIYSGGRGWRGRGAWSTDFPKADRQFLFILKRLLTLLDLHEWENPVALDDPNLRRFPFLYMLEVGHMNLTPSEIEGLRGFLEAGGFVVVDDFWGEREWANFEYHMSLVLPDREIRPIPQDHPIFHQFYDIERVLQVPNVGNGVRGGPYGECWGPCDPGVFGIFDDRGELMMVINFNTDLGDAWEWSENPYYPIDRSNYAYEMAINLIIYALSH